MLDIRRLGGGVRGLLGVLVGLAGLGKLNALGMVGLRTRRLLDLVTKKSTLYNRVLKFIFSLPNQVSSN